MLSKWPCRIGALARSAFLFAGGTSVVSTRSAPNVVTQKLISLYPNHAQSSFKEECPGA
jgi:hypothetical protein